MDQNAKIKGKQSIIAVNGCLILVLKSRNNARMHFKLRRLFFPINRRCSGCKKKRSLRTNSFFEEFPRVPLGTLLLTIYHFVSEDSQRQTARRLNLNPGLVSKIYRRLQDVCSRDLDERPFTPFGGSGAAVKCDESKFNHKAKVRTLNKCQKLLVTLKKSQAYLC